MISNKLRRKIESNLKLHIDSSLYSKIDDMFKEVYLTTIDGEDRLTLKPSDNKSIALQFSALTGTFLEITDWEYIKNVGTLV